MVTRSEDLYIVGHSATREIGPLLLRSEGGNRKRYTDSSKIILISQSNKYRFDALRSTRTTRQSQGNIDESLAFNLLTIVEPCLRT